VSVLDDLPRYGVRSILSPVRILIQSRRYYCSCSMVFRRQGQYRSDVEQFLEPLFYCGFSNTRVERWSSSLDRNIIECGIKRVC
jgi:hypothetical protein